MNTLTWNPLEGPRGNRVTVSNDYTAVAVDHRMGLWRGNELLGTWEHPSGRSGWPVFTDGKLYWAEWIIPLDDTGGARQIPVMSASVQAELGVDMVPTPTGAYNIEGMQWNREGTGLLVSVGWRGPGNPDTHVFELDGQGQWKGIIWQGNQAAPRAYWGGNGEWILGFAQPLRTGNDSQPIPGLVAPLRLTASDDGKSLLIVRPNQLEVWDLTSQTDRFQAPGTWLDADLGPDGSFIFATSMQHTLLRLDCNGGSTHEMNIPAPIAAVSVDRSHVAASFSSGWQVGQAKLP